MIIMAYLAIYVFIELVLSRRVYWIDLSYSVAYRILSGIPNLTLPNPPYLNNVKMGT